MKKSYFYISLISFFLTSVVHAEQFVFEGPAKYKKADQTSYSELKAGEALELNEGESALLVTAQGMPMLIFSAKSRKSTVHVSAANLSGLVISQAQSYLDRTANEVVDGLRKTENLLQKREYQQALTVVSGLKEKYGQISSVLFMSATVQYLLKNKSAASEDLQRGLKIEPENPAAKKLLAQVKGDS